MQVLREIKERRLIPLSAAYLVTGFVALEAIDQLISYGFVPAAAYPVTLVLYLFGIPSSFVFAWFHGAPGRQYAVRGEILLQAALGIMAAITGIYVYRTQVVALDVAAEMGLPPTTIAVLPFEDVSSRGDIGYVADGITEALIDQLHDVRSLDVISITGVSQFRNTTLRPDSIARILSVGTIIMGSVDQQGEDLRITTRLVDGVGGADIDRAILEIPAGQFIAATDSVAGAVSRLLRERLGEDVRVRELRAGTTNQDAWALAQRAERLSSDAEDRFESGGETDGMIQAYEAVDSVLALAEELDPRWVRLPAARAYAAYRRGWVAANTNDLVMTEREIESGLDHAARALALDASNAFALEQRGTLKVLEALMLAREQDEYDRLLSEARSDLETATREDPSLATAHGMLSFVFVLLGNNPQAIVRATQALEEDAYLRGADRIIDRLIYAQYDLGQFNESRYWCGEGYRRFPDNFRFTECALSLIAAPGGGTDVDSAWTLMERLDDLVPEALRPLKHGVGLVMVAGVLRNADLPDSAANVLSRVDHSEQADPERLLYEYEAGILATTGNPPDADGAIRVLERWAAASPDARLGTRSNLHWWWRGLQTREDFQPFISPE